MHRIALLAGIVMLVLAGCEKTNVGEHMAPAPVAAPQSIEEKAEALEQNAAAGNKTVPSAEVIKRPEAQALDPTGREPLDDALTCLARTVYWEARGDSEASMEAIASVVMNRLGHHGFPDTVCGVVKQGHEQSLCQFSWWCDGKSDQPTDAPAWAQAESLARAILADPPKARRDPTRGALFFHSARISTPWVVPRQRTVRIGHHIFYR